MSKPNLKMQRVRITKICENCGKEFSTNRKRQKFCHKSTCKNSNDNPQLENDILEEDMSRSNKGDFCEIYACAEFMRRGYLVFKHMGSNSPFDIIIYKKGKFTKVEIKSGRINPRTNSLYFSKPTHEDYDIVCVVCLTDKSIHIKKKKDI